MFLFAFLVLYILLTFALKSLYFWKNSGINPITFDRKDDAHGFMGTIFIFVSSLTISVVAIYAFKNSFYKYLLPFWYLEKAELYYTGWILLVLSLILIIIAQYQMAESWRIGIDLKNSVELVQNGVFAYSRNPIYIGIIFSKIALFLIIPNAFTLLTSVVSTICVHIQVRLEEAHLFGCFQDDYEKYSSQVRRWV